MNSDAKRHALSANDVMRKAAADRAPPPPKPKQLPDTQLKSGVRVGEVYWCDFAHTNPLPEFDAEHLVVIIKSAKLVDASLVVPLTKKDQSASPHGYKLTQNPNRQTSEESWAVCDHIYAVSSARLRQLRNESNQLRTPFPLAEHDIREISKRVFKVLSPFLQKGVDAPDLTSQDDVT